MDNIWDQMREALRQAREIESAAAQNADRMVEMLMLGGGGPLRKANAYWLRQMKKSLENFNSTTGKWKR